MWENLQKGMRQVQQQSGARYIHHQVQGHLNGGVDVCDLGLEAQAELRPHHEEPWEEWQAYCFLVVVYGYSTTRSSTVRHYPIHKSEYASRY